MFPVDCINYIRNHSKNIHIKIHIVLFLFNTLSMLGWVAVPGYSSIGIELNNMVF